MNWYKRYLGDYRRKTGQLTMLEHAAYMLLLDEYYAAGASLPAEIERLNRICHANNGAERKAVKDIANQYFQLNGDGTRHNARCDEEIAKFQAQSTVNSAIAKAREAMKRKARTVHEPSNESLHLPEVRYQIPERPTQPDAPRLSRLSAEQALRDLHVKVKTPQSTSTTTNPATEERNRAIAQALAEGNTDEAQRLRESP